MKNRAPNPNEFVVHCLMCGKNFRAGDKPECGGFFAGKPICKTKHIQIQIDARLAARKEQP